MSSQSQSFIIPDNIDLVTKTDKYISLPFMTKYEFDQIIGLRTMHLSRGAIPFIILPDNFKCQGNMDLRKIALQELQEKKLPYLVKRAIPNSSPEYWPVSQLNIDTIRYMMR